MNACLLWLSLVVSQDAASLPTPAAQPQAPASSEVAPDVSLTAMADRAFGLHAAAGIGTFAVDLQHGHFFALLGGSPGVALLSNGDWIPFAVLVGYTTTVSRSATRAWMFEATATFLPGIKRGWGSSSYVTSGYFGAGATVGMRFEHRSGVSVALRLPVFGYHAAHDVTNSSTGVGYYYLTALMTLPLVSLGYRF